MLKAFNTCDTRAIDIEEEERREPTSEMHLNDIMGSQEHNMTNTFKATKKVLEASFKEAELDVHFVTSLCIQKSRESFQAQFKKYVSTLQEVAI
jgi:hypothetical protein